MILRPIACAALLSLLAPLACAQTAPVPIAPAQPAPPAFLAAELHPSQHRAFPFYYNVMLHDRYLIRDASIVDLVSTAYSLDRERVVGGPSWLEMDRFDITAKVPDGPTPSSDALALMLRTLLTQRFQLTFHNGSKPIPAYGLALADPGKPNSHLQPASGGDPGCDYKPTPGQPTAIHFVCHAMTMDALAQYIRTFLDKPIANSTALNGAFDFEFTWVRDVNAQTPVAAAIPLIEALPTQLGLTLKPQTAPIPVLVVDTVRETPTPNPANIATLLPPPPPPQYEVATIKPSAPDSRLGGRVQPDIVNYTNIRLRDLLYMAWGLDQNDPDLVAGAPAWATADRYDVYAKVPPEVSAITPKGMPMDLAAALEMLKALLIDRFQIKYHLEDRPATAYALFALTPGNSKMKPADPDSRTRCFNGPPPDGVDPRIKTPVFNRILTCRNATMAQLAENLHRAAGFYITGPVEDRTGLTGGYDFTLAFSSSGHFQNMPPEGAPAEPDGALTLAEALRQQLGLRIEKIKRPQPVLVLDHIEEKPLDN